MATERPITGMRVYSQRTFDDVTPVLDAVREVAGTHAGAVVVELVSAVPVGPGVRTAEIEIGRELSHAEATALVQALAAAFARRGFTI